MKVRIVGDGRVLSNYLTYGKVYDAEVYLDDDSLATIEDDDGDTIIIRVGGFCAHISVGEDLRWVVVDD